MPQLEVFLFLRNSLFSSFPPYWNTPNLRVFAANLVGFGGSPSDSFLSHPQLEVVDLLYTGLQKSLDIPISTAIREIYIRSWTSDGSGEVPDAWKTSTNLEVFEMQASGVIPDWLNTLPKLRIVNVRCNNGQIDLRSTLCGMPSIEIFYAQSCQAIGGLPACVGSATTLRELVLSFSSVNGSVPSELANLSQLRILALDHTRLGGVLPPQLADLQYLQNVCFGFSGFTGLIPNVSVSSEFHAVCRGAQFRGPLPASFALKPLSWFTVVDCALSGGVPSSFVALKDSMCEFTIMSNTLSGPIQNELEPLFVRFGQDRVLCAMGGNNRWDCPVPDFMPTKEPSACCRDCCKAAERDDYVSVDD